MTWQQDFPKAKALTTVGLIISACVGSAIAMSIAGLLIHAVGAGYILSFAFQISALYLGAFNGAIAYLQMLKVAQKWPLESGAPFVFSPAVFWTDFKTALRNIDWEILKFGSLVFADSFEPGLRENLRHQEVSQNIPFFSRMGQHVNNFFRGLARTGTEEYLLPCAVRNIISTQIHALNYEYALNQNAGLSQSDRDNLKQQERLNYQATPFMSELTVSGKGFFETIGATIVNEYEHPPTIPPARPQMS